MTISESFLELLRRIQPSPAEIRSADQRISTIRSCLSNGFNVSKCQTLGSYSRQTSITGFSDTDLLAVFRKSEFTRADKLINSNTALDNVRTALLGRYPGSDIRRDGIAVGILFSDGRKVEVVPGVFRGMFEKWPVYLIPDGIGSWKSTSPSLYDAYIARANLEAKGKLIAVAQLVTLEGTV